ncbi:hypothetical protein [Algoriphagus formosus]|uniref:Uncharacterized protein n=1 Tax=Algoriphagus formosus TaxID=2007308 RepID=A0A4R5VFR8_9BACT|nr:hypothetical protein [Algoriphagus aquimaris]MCR9080893.1 hypothetical protein [Cyclobacteriaceae bacterium]TDK51472.1 hypothetical protein E1898_00035 [Algoriphagus aquimaris]
MNLKLVTENNPIKGYIHYECAFDTETGIYFPKGKVEIKVMRNNSHGGYCGNTLFQRIGLEDKKLDFDIRIRNFLFSSAKIFLNFEGSIYRPVKKAGYLRLNADLISKLEN